MTFHINTDSGKVDLCVAQKGNCPFGGDDGSDNHYESVKESLAASEKMMESKWGNPNIKKTSYTEELLEHASNGISRSTQFLNKLREMEEDEEIYLPDETDSFFSHPLDTVHQQELGIHAVEQEGYLVDKNYFARKQVSGTIDYNKLNETSYKEFGFATVDPVDNLTSRMDQYQDSVDYRTHVKLSRAELNDLDERELRALSVFSNSELYEHINVPLYNSTDDEEILQGQYDDVEDTVDLLSGDVMSDEFEDFYPEELLTKRNYAELINNLDSAIAKGPGEQRVLYRGVSAASGFIMNYYGSVDDYGVDDYVEKNFTLGSEIQFNGYQSSSSNPLIAKRFANEGFGVVCEILTPAGINMSSMSDFDEESEVLLPRQSRYMVVGTHKIKRNGKSPSETNIVQLVAINDKGEVLTAANMRTPSPLVAPEKK